MFENKKGWEELPIGGVITEPGSSVRNKTGGWRTFRPIWHEEKCTHCMICFVYCPDSAILVKEGKVIAIDYDFCKGCGLCAKECPPKFNAIEMKLESDFL